jgi:hypothetical protein
VDYFSTTTYAQHHRSRSVSLFLPFPRPIRIRSRVAEGTAQINRTQSSTQLMLLRGLWTVSRTP